MERVLDEPQHAEELLKVGERFASAAAAAAAAAVAADAYRTSR